MTPLIPALILFAAAYIGMLTFGKYRTFIALGAALVFVLTGLLPLSEVATAIDLNVLLMIAGTMGTVALMIESKMPNLMADVLLDHVPNVKWAIVALALFAGVVSAFIDNVATVLMIAPIGLAIAKKLNISSTKSMTGHLLGAAGAMEALVCVKTVQEDIVPPTINHEEGDEDPEIDYSLNYTFNKAQKRVVNVALSNTFGFGGHNASLIVKKFVK